jgi:hypothetical protein
MSEIFTSQHVINTSLPSNFQLPLHLGYLLRHKQAGDSYSYRTDLANSTIRNIMTILTIFNILSHIDQCLS